MLVLSRKAGESIVIGDSITVNVLEIRGDLIRIGIDAPRNIKVHRHEVYEAIEAANKEAATASVDAISDFAQALGEMPAPQQEP